MRIYAALGANLLAGLKALWPALHDTIIAIAATEAQRNIDEGKDAKDTLAAVKQADKAAAALPMLLCQACATSGSDACAIFESAFPSILRNTWLTA